MLIFLLEGIGHSKPSNTHVQSISYNLRFIKNVFSIMLIQNWQLLVSQNFFKAFVLSSCKYCICMHHNASLPSAMSITHHFWSLLNSCFQKIQHTAYHLSHGIPLLPSNSACKLLFFKKTHVHGYTQTRVQLCYGFAKLISVYYIQALTK